MNEFLHASLPQLLKPVIDVQKITSLRCGDLTVVVCEPIGIQRIFRLLLAASGS